MDTEEELTELQSELLRRSEDKKIIDFVNSKEYRVLLKKESLKICELCGKEYKMTHLCDTARNFTWNDFWKHYNARKVPQSKSGRLPQKTYTYEKKVEISTNKTSNNSRKSESNCGACLCVLVIIVILLFIF